MSKNRSVKKIVRDYVAQLRRHKFPFTHVFLYGSYATGQEHAGSDIDVCVISKQFQGQHWDKYERQLWQLRRPIDTRIEPIGLSLADFNGLSPLAAEIKKNGVLIR